MRNSHVFRLSSFVSRALRVTSRPASRSASMLLGAAATLGLAGCAMSFVSDPGQLTPATVSEPPTAVSLYGGHAPLVGAKMYVLTPSTTTQAGVVTSLMKNSTTNTQYPVMLDTSGGVTNGMYYVTTDQYGVANLTGSYSCTANQPVYLAATGGAPSYSGAGPNTFALASIVVSNLAGTTGGAGTATYTFNLKSPATQLFYVGEQITFSGTQMSGLNGSQGPNGPVFFNSNITGTYTITGTGLTTSSFQTTFTGDFGGYTGATNAYFPAGTYTQPAGATVTGTPVNNPAVVNMAALGICPTSGNFSTAGNGALSYVFMNEVSTTAMAFATSAFGTDAFHIGVNQGGTLNTTLNPGYVTGSMVQAFNNAYLLYDVTGGNQGTAYAGEGHIARTTTPVGNGTVPQTTVDTIGNILAACVDSANTSSSASTQCSTLFATATSDGSLTGTKPTDISGAAFNIAHHPAGYNNVNFVHALYIIPTGNVPFLPQLGAEPNDYSLTLQFAVNSSAVGANLINNPQIVTLDGSPYSGLESGTSSPANAVWVGSYGGQPLKMFTNGVPDYSTNAGGLATSTRARSIAFDNSNNPWILNEATGATQHFSNTGTLLTTIPAAANGLSLFNNGTFVALDSSSNLYIDNEDLIQKTNSAGANIQPGGTLGGTYWSANNGTIGGTLTTSPYTNTVNLDSTGLVYTITNNGTLCVADPTSANCNKTLGGFSVAAPNNTITFSSIDANNMFWSPNTTNNNVVGYSYTSNSIKYTCTGGGLNYPAATAVDGAGNIWVANVGAVLNTGNYNSISEFGPTCTALSPTTGYGALNGNLSLNSASLAIDRAGNIWVVYSGYNYLYEVIGIATPTVSPTAFATFNGFLGKIPK